MKIRKIIIKNLKSIKDLEIECNDKINVFIGKNGSGKTAALIAMYALIANDVHLVKSLKNNLARLDNLSIKAVFEGGEESEIKAPLENLNQLNKTGTYIERYQYFTNINHNPLQSIPQGVIDTFQNKETYQANEGTNYLKDKILDKSIQVTSATILMNGIEHPTLSDGEKMQLFFEAAKAENVKYIFLDEPENHLHPHAKKSLYNKLKELSAIGKQIFYATHSAEFLSYENSEEVHRFYIDGSNGTKIAKGNKSFSMKDSDNDIENNKISFNNAFFADTVFIVEGFSDYLFLKHIIESKNKKSIDELNISIINARRKSPIKHFYDLYNKLNIQTFALYDKDLGNSESEKLNPELEKVQNSYGFEKGLENFLNYEVIPNNEESKGDAKVRLMQKWIDSTLTEQKQSKIDEIYKKITEKLPDLFKQ